MSESSPPPSQAFVPALGPSHGVQVINYESSEGLKTYKRATAALKDEYSGKSDGVAVFRMQLASRAKTEGWADGNTADVVNIPKDGVDASNGTINVLKENTQLSIDTIKAWAKNNLRGRL